MKGHVLIGSDILAGNSSPYFQMGHDIALGHHERWDGNGYPDGLFGVAWPSIRLDFNVPLDAVGLLLFMSTTGYLTSSFFSGKNYLSVLFRRQMQCESS